MSTRVMVSGKQMAICAIAGLLSLSLSSPASAAYLDDIGYTALQAELGAATPTGAGVRVTQVEAPVNDVSGGAAPVFMPDPGDGLFAGKTITAVNGNPSGSFSGHATAVGRLFYGNGSSMASGITQVSVYEANSWLNSLFVANGAATISSSRIANSSWVGGGSDGANDGTVLRLVDRQVALKEYIQVVGTANGSGNSPLLSSAYNVISVGRTDGGAQQWSVPVSGDALYGVGRTVPTVVAPQGTTSAATPVVSAAAALLVQTGHQGGATLSLGSTAIAGVGTVYNAERSNTVKAALMAGADRQTANTSTVANITDYRAAGHQTVNGLDDRYGAGQVNVYNSYKIIAAGEQRSAQTGGGDIRSNGFSYGTIGGLSGSGRTASYFFNASSDLTLAASLVWNLNVSNDANLTTVLHHLNLSLFDVTRNAMVETSSSSLDNTQNLFLRLFLGDRYELRVTTDESGNFSQDFALAWRMVSEVAPVPVPPAAWLFGSGVGGLLSWFSRQRRPIAVAA